VAKAAAGSPAPCVPWQARRIAPALPESQEDQLRALGLVVDVIVLWNTLYMESAFAQLRAEGHQAREDVACLSPLGFEPNNMLGRYALIQT
jgi:hypothetical protein